MKNLRAAPQNLNFFTFKSKPQPPAFSLDCCAPHPESNAELSCFRRRYLIDFFATWFYLGKMKKAPGTWGTIGAIPLVYALSFAGPLIYMSFVILFLPLSILVSELYERRHGGHDHPEIVIDEVIGFMITMIWLPMTWQSLVFGFLLFRLLDIWKPFPIIYLDRKIQGGLGVVADDVAAGIIASLILQYIYTHTSWLGAHLVLIS
jgi:phosphatidylglycerophosphatase A